MLSDPNSLDQLHLIRNEHELPKGLIASRGSHLFDRMLAIYREDPQYGPVRPHYGLMRRDAYFMRVAFAIAAGSKCVRAQYGTVIVTEAGFPVSTGYNGKPAGSKNDGECYREGLPACATHRPDCCVHSEVNAVLFASPEARRGATMYVTGRPCDRCRLVIMQSGLRRLVSYDPRTADQPWELEAECPEAFRQLYVPAVSGVGSVLRHVPPLAEEDLFRKYGVEIRQDLFTFWRWQEQFGEEGG